MVIFSITLSLWLLIGLSALAYMLKHEPAFFSNPSDLVIVPLLWPVCLYVCFKIRDIRAIVSS